MEKEQYDREYERERQRGRGRESEKERERALVNALSRRAPDWIWPT